MTATAEMATMPASHPRPSSAPDLPIFIIAPLHAPGSAQRFIFGEYGFLEQFFPRGDDGRAELAQSIALRSGARFILFRRKRDPRIAPVSCSAPREVRDFLTARARDDDEMGRRKQPHGSSQLLRDGGI